MPSNRVVSRHIFAVDIERSTYRSNPVKEELRRELYNLIRKALGGAGIKRTDYDGLVDRGDGVLVLIRPVDRVSELLLFTDLVPTLQELLRGRNEGIPAAERPVLGLRLRVVLHTGLVHYDGHGPFGESLDAAFRLLDARRVKTRLKESEKPLVLVVSERLYAEVLRHDYPEIETAGFEQIYTFVGENRQRGWMC